MLPSDTKFAIAMKFIFSHEGGYVNHPNDPGGETKYGISKRAHPNEDIKNLTQERAYEIYKRSYWDFYKIGDLPLEMSIVVMDSYVQHSPVAVKRMIVEASHGWLDLINKRRAFYTRLVTLNPKNLVFAKGWNNRMNDLEKYVMRVQEEMT